LELFWAETPVQKAQLAIKIIAKSDLESDLENDLESDLENGREVV
jgi:hypothetical protein